MGNRRKTGLSHVTKSSKRIRVTSEDGKYFIGNTNERAEGRMIRSQYAQHLDIIRNHDIDDDSDVSQDYCWSESDI